MTIVLTQAVKALFPPGALQDGVLSNLLTKTYSQPPRAISASVISQQQLTLDAALMAVERLRWASVSASGREDPDNGRVLWWLADSSPQQHDWFLCQSESLTKRQAAELFEACVALATWSGDQEGTQARREDVWNLADDIERHVWPPGALGSGRLSMVHKLSTWSQSVWLETGSMASINTVFDESVSLTPDFGTEAALPEAMDIELHELLPSWAVSDLGLQPDMHPPDAHSVPMDRDGDDDLVADGVSSQAPQPNNKTTKEVNKQQNKTNFAGSTARPRSAVRACVPQHDAGGWS
jgi:hypothetical protein